jgi:hypothetical protein
LPGRPLLISQPVRISVHAGFPDQGHFSLIPSQWVFGGFRLRNDVKFTVVVGDTFSNPVQAGTAIYFHSQAGVIQTGQGAYTDVTGLATVSLNPVNPTPDVAGSNIAGRPTFDTTFDARIGGRIGYYWVVAQTQGANGKLVHDSVLVCQDEAPITVTGIPNSPVMVDSITGVSAPITIKVTDVHGNPLPNGSTISASITLPSNPPTGLAAAVLGDISTDFPREIPTYAEARFPARFITDFTFRVANTGSISHITVGVKITISAPDILETLTLSFPAYLQP